MADQSNPLISRWIDLLFEQGPIGVLAAGGTIALVRGLFPVFYLPLALFGAGLLIVAAAVHLLIWVARNRSAERDMDRAYTIHKETGKSLEEVRKDLVTARNAPAMGQRLQGKDLAG
jgi:hypothetical protein